jgi:hypothetical protein
MTRQDRIEDMLTQRQFDHKDVRALMDEMSAQTLTARLGYPAVEKRYFEGSGSWQPGDGRPTLADEDPAVMQAIGRCLAHRVRGQFSLSSIHPTTCDWCDYPTEELVVACDWAAWQSRYVIANLNVWVGAETDWGKPTTYARSGPVDYYENPRWREFWAMGHHERGRAIASVRQPTV